MSVKAKVKMPLKEASTPVEIGSVTRTNGVPSYVPAPDQLPLAYDENSGVLYFYTTEWKTLGLHALGEVNLGNLTNLDHVIRIPVSYDTGVSKVEGYVTLKEFKSLING